MSKRKSNKKITQHDKKVLDVSRALKRNGWNVKADLPKYKKPDSIGRSRRKPDIQATKRGATRIYEVETGRSLEKDKNQRRTFQRYAANKPRTSFKTITTKRKSSKKKKM